jgi:hypothetical protein
VYFRWCGLLDRRNEEIWTPDGVRTRAAAVLGHEPGQEPWYAWPEWADNEAVPSSGNGWYGRMTVERHAQLRANGVDLGIYLNGQEVRLWCREADDVEGWVDCFDDISQDGHLLSDHVARRYGAVEFRRIDAEPAPPEPSRLVLDPVRALAIRGEIQ